MTAVKQAPETHDLASILQELQSQGILLANPPLLKGYLAAHVGLASLLGEMCRQVRAAFDPSAELSLELYQDREIDDAYLSLYVRLEKYDSHFMDRLDAIGSTFHKSLEGVSGHFLVTTDFRRPREANVV
ncbi:MAG: hypothetical protein HYR84_12275 [Planctomycetes bacterium]|nr:hypothetical protein [Planctomycetota bacterium]